ncbi:MAG: hypothetical protein ACLP1X_14365 [Polyangiaceae bacterium]|jgi:hypothetical protein
MRGTVDREALVVAMTLVPRLVSRNRSFAFFEDAEVRRARARAALLRGIVRQLAGAQGRVEALNVAPGPSACEMRYRVPAVRMERRALLSHLEYGCIAYLAGRAGVSGIHANDEDRARIEASLRRLTNGLRLADIDGDPPT